MHYSYSIISTNHCVESGPSGKTLVVYTHHFSVPRVDDGAVDVELVDDVGGLVPPAFGHRLLRVNLPCILRHG